MNGKIAVIKFRNILRWIPYPIRKLILLLKFLAGNPGRWPSIFLAGKPEKGKISVFYGYDHIPNLDEPAHGGIVKFQRMQNLFPNTPRHFNLLYMVSSVYPPDWAKLLWLARHKGARLVWNQNGVGYVGWHGPGWERINKPMVKMVHEVDYVFYQSRFCKLSADHFLGERHGPWEILYNAVDTRVFTPTVSDPDLRHLVLLLGGSQSQYYRLESALQTIAILAHHRKDVRLLVTGMLDWILDKEGASRLAQRLVKNLDIADRVEFLGPYTQAEAPAIFQRAHLLLHTQYNDASPGLVIEAMACGLAVVYSKSGGAPELVGEDAGIGIPAPLSWDRYFPPDPEALANAVLRIAEQRERFAEAARQRAVEHFDLKPWIKRHHEVFEELLCK